MPVASEELVNVGWRARGVLFLAVAALVLCLAATCWGGNAGADSYPRLANIFFGSLGTADLELLARWDLLVLARRAVDLNVDELRELRSLNPDAVLLAHMAVGYTGAYASPPINADLSSAIEANDWWMRDTRGERFVLGDGTYLLNMSLDAARDGDGKRLCDWLPEYIYERVVATGLWDGVYLDYCLDRVAWHNERADYAIDADGDGVADERDVLDERWRLGMRECIARLRQLAGDDFIIMTNGNNTHYDLCDGDTREKFPEMHGGWYENVMNEEHGYLAFEALYRQPSINIINTIWDGDAGPAGPSRGSEFENEFLLGLASTLVFGNGYFSCDGPNHSQAWWFDYYDVELGKPLGKAEPVEASPGRAATWVDLTEHIAARRFERGIAVVNPTLWTHTIDLGGAYYDVDSWNGRFYEWEGARTSVSLSCETGEVLVGRGTAVQPAVRPVEAVVRADGVELTWNGAAAADSYSVYRSDAESGGDFGATELLAVVGQPYYFDAESVIDGVRRYCVAPIDDMNCEGRRSPTTEVSTEPGSGLSAALMVDDYGGLPVLRWRLEGEPGSGATLDIVRSGGGEERLRLNDVPLSPVSLGVWRDDTAEAETEYLYELLESGDWERVVASVRYAPPEESVSWRTSFDGCHPLPAAGSTTLSFTIGGDSGRSAGAVATLTVVDVSGRVVRRLISEALPSGVHDVEWDLCDDSGARVASGCYMCVLEAGAERVTGKALVLR